ncbi:FAD dependent oxidoreductase-like protein [Periconia macrospinosa]|uniref:FAD dependent oxidoreductase-like protein n=1 Tax=Periconia macrospinosa TaxID=97972 RepID=A0A2V1CZU9_9PLEO|nr:FAD dependent oxidoreductase-like protein [Periconia macrospinosa]
MPSRSRIPVGPPISNPLPSYWTSPKSPLSATIEPSTASPSTPYDYAIIGSGISGTLTAYNLLLSHPGSRIILLDAREICNGATGRNGGHTKAGELGTEEALKIVRLEWENIRATHGLAKELGIKYGGRMCNTVDLVYDAATFEAGKKGIEALREDVRAEEKERGNMAWYEVYEGMDGVKQKFWTAERNANSAVAGDGPCAGASECVAGQENAYRFTTGVLKECVRMGLELAANTPVHDVRLAEEGGRNGKHRYDVCTQYGVIPAQTVVLATNAYTPYLLKKLQGAIVPMRGQITAQKPPRTAKHPSVLTHTYSFIYKDGYEYMVPTQLEDGGQHIVIGGGLGRLPGGGPTEFGTVDDSCLNKELSTYLCGTVAGYFGHPDGAADGKNEGDSYETVAEWTGIMGATADGRPFVGEVPGKEGMWAAVGFNGHGMVLCLKSAEALVKMIRGEGSMEGLEWFPKSFLITEERLAKCEFRGRTDMSIPETGEKPVAAER